MNFRRIDALTATVTYNEAVIGAPTNNTYEAISITAKCATQINAETEEELMGRLEAFATSSGNLEEIFENKEQIEVSRFYERLPKSQAIAVREWLEGKVYFHEAG